MLWIYRKKECVLWKDTIGQLDRIFLYFFKILRKMRSNALENNKYFNIWTEGYTTYPGNFGAGTGCIFRVGLKLIIKTLLFLIY